MRSPRIHRVVGTAAAPGSRRQAASIQSLIGLAVAVILAARAQHMLGADQFNLIFTSATMGGINETDAKAALRVWAANILGTAGVKVETVPAVLGTNEMIQAFQAGRADAGLMLTPEFLSLSRKVPMAHLFFASRDGDIHETYLLLVSAESPAKQAADLRGKKLALWEHSRMSLAHAWLTVLLSRAALPRPESFFGSMATKSKPNNAVLPVFFGTADACVINRRAYETIIEMNPQVGKKLRALAESPQLIPLLFCFRASLNAPWSEGIMKSIREIHKNPAGQQIVTIYQFGHLEERPPDVLQNSRLLLEEFSRIVTPGAPGPYKGQPE